MSGSISFATIPADLRVPLFYAEFDSSRAGPSVIPQRALLIGQATAAGVAEALRFVTTAEEVAQLCGAGSVIARMMAAYRANDPVGEVWILPLQDAGGGVAATGSIAVTGTAAETGSIALYIGGQKVSVAVTSGDTATTVGNSIAAAINALASLPATATSSTGTVTVTARNKGTLGNGIDIRHSYGGSLAGEKLPAGVSLAITAMASGATDPVTTNIATILGDLEFDFIAQPITATGWLDAMRDAMNDTSGRWSYARQAYGHVWSAKVDSAANLITLGQSRNDQHATILGVADCPTWAPEIAAATMAACAVALKADPARPVQTVTVTGLRAPPVGSRFALTTRQSLLSNGIALLGFGADGSAAIVRMVTSYRLNKFGVADTAYLDVETLFTLMAVIRRLRQAVTTKFARSKLANDGTRFGPGQPIVTPSSFKAELVAQYAALEAEGLVEDAAGFAAATIVQRNPNDQSRLDVLYAPNLVNGLRVLAVLAQFRG